MSASRAESGASIPPSVHARGSVSRDVPLFKRLLVLLQPPLRIVLSPDAPLEWYHELRPYQKVGVVALMSQSEMLLADEMGLGKTVQAIGALRLLFRRQEIESSIIAAPAGLLNQWRAEIADWAPELRVSVVRGAPGERTWQWRAPVHVYLVGYETLRADVEAGVPDVTQRDWGVFVIDEAQKIKNRESATASAVQQLRRKRAWALTGTPLENRLDDLESILEFLAPAVDSTRVDLSTVWGLRARQSEVQLRRKKRDVLPELPPKIAIPVEIELTDVQRSEYDRLEREGVRTLNELGATARVEHVLELITRLKQICNFSTGPRESAKLSDVEERLEEIVLQDHRALVFSQFADERFGAQAIAAAISRFRPLVYTGALSAGERSVVIERFASDPTHRVLVLSLRAGGQGLNLQEASFVFHFDRWWNPAVERQAEDRAHRMGQGTAVTVYKYVCKRTIEERIDRILVSKQGLFERLIDDVSLDLRTRLTAEELFGLFGLEVPAVPRKRDAGTGVDDFHSMGGEGLELYVKRRLESAGWQVSLTPLSHDGGIDLRAVRHDELGIGSTLLVQCKNQQTAVGVEPVRAFNGVLAESGRGTAGLFVCPAGFTAGAREFARRAGIRLWDVQQLSEAGPFWRASEAGWD